MMVIVVAANAESFSLVCDEDILIIENVQQFSVGEIVVNSPINKGDFTYGRFAEIWLFPTDVERLKLFTSRHEAKKIKLLFGDSLLAEVRLLNEIDNGRITLTVRSEDKIEKLKEVIRILAEKKN